MKDTGDKIPAVIASTASPYKFTRSVMDAISEGHENLDDFGLADALEKLSGWQFRRQSTISVLHQYFMTG